MKTYIGEAEAKQEKENYVIKKNMKPGNNINILDKHEERRTGKNTTRKNNTGKKI